VTVKTRLAINLTAVVLLGLLMVGWVVTQLVGANGIGGPWTVTADFKSTGGVFTNQEVAYRGVVIGKVGSLELNDNDGVDIELLIDPKWENKIPADSVANILSKSAVGEQFVNLTPRSSSGETLGDGDEIARADTQLPVDFQQLLTSLDEVVGDVPVGRTGRLVRNVAQGLRGRGDDIGTILKSIGRLSGTFASVADEQQSLLDNATVAGSAFLRTKDDFSRAMAAADRVLAGIGDEPAELEHLFSANDRFARAGIALLARHGRNLERGIKSLGDFTDYQLANQDTFVNSLEYVPQFLHAIEESSIPWETPDGRKFYLIRTGLVVDTDPKSWPCKYELPLHWERYPHVRTPRPTNTNGKCVSATAPTPAEVSGLVDALRKWSEGDDTGMFPASTAALPDSVESFIWPLSGPITSYFGPRDGSMHTGLDIDGVEGDPVVAAAGGAVVYAGAMDGYGNIVVVDHGGGLVSAYAHLSEMAVRPGDPIEQGGLIGAVGCTGHCTGSHLHFEVRVNGTPVDPLPYLPGGFIFTAPPEEPTDQPSPEPTDQPSPKPSETPAPDSSKSPRPQPSPAASRNPGPIHQG
jgi:virulence factor Mce-like protein